MSCTSLTVDSVFVTATSIRKKNAALILTLAAMKLATWKRQAGTTLSCFLTMLLLPHTSGKHHVTAYRDGDVILGGLFNLHFAGHEERCNELFTMGLGHAEAMIFAIDRVNKDPNLLPNVTVGYDIRNYCMDRQKAMEHTYHFSTDLHLLRQSDGDLTYQNDTLSACYVTCSACMHCLKSNDNSTIPIAAIVGPYGSRNSLQVAGLLQVVNIPAISPSASSE